jgi:hypothetical protein
LVLLGLLAGCGGGGQQITPLIDSTPAVVEAPGAEEAPTRNRLVASMPALGSLAAGSEFDYLVSVELAEELYQCSARVGYDAAVVQPVTAEYGALIPADAVRLPWAEADGVVPLAFTALPGRAGIQSGRGELLRVTFRLTGAPSGGRAVWLVNEAEFLQLRDRVGRRLSFDLASEEVQQ